MTASNPNVDEIKKKIAKAVDEIIDLKKTRSGVNAEIAAIIERMEALGINRHGLRFAIKYYESNEATREGFDIGYQLSREALGVSIQADLFQDLDKVKETAAGGGDATEETS